MCTPPHRNNNFLTVARVPTREVFYGHSQFNDSHSERSEESQSTSHNKCFVPQHDKHQKTHLILVRLKQYLHPIASYYLAALLRKAVFFAFWR